MKTLITTLNAKYIHSSLAIRYLRSYVSSASYNRIDIKDYTINQHIDEIVMDIYEKKYDLVVLSTYIWNYNEIKRLSRMLKKVQPESTILLGGPEVSYKPGSELEKMQWVDFIIFGEGEATFKEFLAYYLDNKGSLEAIDGLAYRKNGKIYVNKERELIKNLDTIPFPYQSFEGLDNKIIYYESTRGCPFNCSYCLSSTIKGVRFFSVDRVKKDLKVFLDRNVKQVKFVDRTFNVDKDHYFEILKYLAQEDNGVTNFHFEITASLLEKEVLEFLKHVRAGLFQFEIGVQSTSGKTLSSINRNIKFNKINTNIKKVIDTRKLHVHLDLIAGLPYEDYSSFMNSFDDVYQLYPDKLQLGFLKLLKGSDIKKNSELHEYVYNEEPPYEAYFNKYISFDEMIKLYKVEELLDLYYGSHYFDNSIRYLVEKKYIKPHVFYEKFVEYWDAKGYFGRKHSKMKKYQILLAFYDEAFGKDDKFIEIVKYDYLVNKNRKASKLFQRLKISNFRDKCHTFLQEKDHLKKYLPQFENKNAKYIIKRVHFEVFKFDVLTYITSGFEKYDPQKQTVLFDYSTQTLFERSKSYRIEL